MNPCTCIGYAINPPAGQQPCCPPGDCLQLCHIVVMPENSVGPCAKQGVIDLNDPTYGHDTQICTSPLQWQFVKIKDTSVISNVSVTPGGMLTFTTGGGASQNKFTSVIVKGSCGMYSAYIEVLIGIKNLCATSPCTPAQICDPCTGNCEDKVLDVKIRGQNALVP